MKPKIPKPGERQAILDARRNLKMAQSAHAYVRGNTLKFYEWLDSSKRGSLPEGPPIWICGDCHVGNLGPVANARGNVEIEIRDLDQTVIGNPAHDLIRLALSLATAIRGSDLPGVTTARMLERMILGYQEALSTTSSKGEASGSPTKPIKFVLKQALNRKWRHLAEERIEDVSPSIPLGERFWALSREEKRETHRIFETESVRKLITGLQRRDDDDDIEVLDCAYWMKGCSSLGRLRYAVLLRVGKGDHKNAGLCLIDMKEAGKAAAPRSADAAMPRDNAKRVVEGARKLSPYLGQRMLPITLLDRPIVVRELLPQDLKLEMDQLTRDEAVESASFLAGVVGNAHARQLDAKSQNQWRSELNRSRSKSLNAPSWLWTSVVDLISSHERAYLEHCRQYALADDET